MSTTVRIGLLLSLSLLSACGGVGNGVIATSTRDVGAFQRVEIHSGFRARVTQGAPSVVVRTDENLMHLVFVGVEGGTLVVRTDPVFQSLHTTLEVDVSTERLEGVAASGASRVTSFATPTQHFPLRASGASVVDLDGLSTETLDLDVSGASEVNVTGQARAGTAQVSGGSRAQLTVPFETLRVDVSGASSLRATVSREVTGEASGASRVTIGGGASLNVEVSGASTLTSGAN